MHIEKRARAKEKRQERESASESVKGSERE